MLELVLLTLGAGGLTPIAGVLVVRAHQQRAWRRGLVAYELRFPRGLDAKDVTAFITALSGLVGPHWSRPIAIRAVIFELSATTEAITHHVVTAKPLAPLVLSALRAALPGVSARLDESYRLARPALAVELALNHHHRTLATDRASHISTAVLASLHPLEAGERVTVQWSINPVGPVAPVMEARPRSEGRPLLFDLIDRVMVGAVHDAETARALREKYSLPTFTATGRIGITADHRGRARALLVRTLAAFHTANTPGVHLRRQRRPAALVRRAFAEHSLSLVTYPAVLNAAELTGLLAFPMAGVMLPGLRLGGTRQLAPAADVASAGRVVARATFPGAERPLALSVTDSLRHLHVVGPTGAGKSTLLLNLIVADMQAGRGVIVIEPSGDLVYDVLDRVPAGRIQDVIVLNAADDLRPVGLNLLTGSQEAPELVVDQIVGIFSNLFRASWGARTDDLLRASLLTLSMRPGLAITEVAPLLVNGEFWRGLVGPITDPVLRGFWSWYDALTPPARSQVIAPLLNKLRAVLLRRRLRNVLGQVNPQLDLDKALAQRKILLVPLSKGLLGEESAVLLGSLVISRVWQSVQGRSALPPDARPVTMAFIDEFQDFLRLSHSVTDVLVQARKLGLGLTLAHQHLDQLSSEVRDAVLANARSKVLFQMTATDAKAFEKELAPHLAAPDLQGLGAHEVVTMLSARGQVTPPATAVTLPPPELVGLGDEARAWSREHYGRDREEVEAELTRRHQPVPDTRAVGRREVKR